jgi:hypothetical protein
MTTDNGTVSAHVLVLVPGAEVDHFCSCGLVKRNDDDAFVWLRRDRDAERDHLKEGTVEYRTVVMKDEEQDRRTQYKELTDKVGNPLYSAVLIPYGTHPDQSNQVVRELSEELGSRSQVCLIVFRCCGAMPYEPTRVWMNGRVCTVPTTGRPTYEEQRQSGQGFPVDDDLAYFIAHAHRPHLDMPAISIGSLLIANTGAKRFYLARRSTGDAKGTFGTIGGPFKRGMSYMESFRIHAVERAGLATDIAAKCREGPVLACTNLIGQLDHSVDITFLVTIDEPFPPQKTRYVSDVGWYSFEEVVEMYRVSSRAVEPGQSYPDPYQEKLLFAPVRNAFEGYCLLLLAGALGDTLLPSSGLSNLGSTTLLSTIKEERAIRKKWLREAALVHERMLDGSPFLHEEPRRDQA